MAGSLSDTFENFLLNFILSTTATFTKPTCYLALFTTTPTDAAAGTEVSGSGYTARLAIPFATPTSTGTISNSSIVDFANMPACTVVGIGIYDSATIGSGTYMFWGTLTTNRTLVAGDTLRIPVGAVTVSLD